MEYRCVLIIVIYSRYKDIFVLGIDEINDYLCTYRFERAASISLKPKSQGQKFILNHILCVL